MRIEEEQAMPDVEPQRIDDASVWTATDFTRQRRWVRELTPAMLAEIDDAVRAVAAKGQFFIEKN